MYVCNKYLVNMSKRNLFCQRLAVDLTVSECWQIIFSTEHHNSPGGGGLGGGGAEYFHMYVATFT